VSSVAVAVGQGLTVSGSPITSSGTITVGAQGNIVTNGMSLTTTVSNVLTIDAMHYISGPASHSTITNTGLTSADAIATDSNGKQIQATAITIAHIAQPGVIVTNGETQVITVSNTFGADAAHYLTGPASHSTITNTGLTSADAVATDSNGKLIGATAVLMSHIAQPGIIVTNGETQVITVSNTFGADAAHFMNGPMSPTLLTNGASGGSKIQLTDSNKKVIDAAASGSVPIDADGSATTAAQISALVTINSSGFTNNVNSQSANYALLSTDWLVLLTGAHTATLPTAVGIGGRSYIIKCSSAGTNAILTTSSQTIDGAAKWTNTAINKFTWVISDNANWRVIGQN